ncbi:hypothetical protein PtA15_2A14 [Puccinia triticina]|uniref:START domain-containing protein n=1 Tax=Puccinia triticina TaxID=208348 RepID=A0ABY7CBE5_9BASI|nr:uncharacterized protein PtA15_2A14 [Puccinia triticina]WAQ81703.1 hypothetical protein PtA15_2A14 [Puccinia triticina]WAR52590.1 hypothetical protein PtB15_2B14 [Puccinia triticina]
MAVSFQETHQRYQAALDSALQHFKKLVDSHHSKHWQLVPPTSTQPNHSRSQFSQTQQANPHHQFLNGLAPIDFSNVQVHRRKLDGSSVVRAICDLSIDPTRFDIDDFKAVLQTAEVRGVWDKLVDKATVIEVLDPQSRIVKTDFRLGWPANPRDSITISKTFTDSNTVIDISTSLPRSADEPAYLRPSPPFVRSHVHLLAWCIQLVHDPPQPSNNPTQSSQAKEAVQTHDHPTDRDSSTQALHNKAPPSKARITVFWKVNWKGAIFSTHHSQIASLLNGFVDYVRNQATEIPIMSSYADGVDFSSASYDKADEKLNLSYSILPEDPKNDLSEPTSGTSENGKFPSDGTRLRRAIELKLPVDQGWDIQVNVYGQGEDVNENWEVMAEKPPDALRTILRITHAKLPKPDQLVRVKVVVQRLAGGKTVRVNQTPVKAATIESSGNEALSILFKEDARSISELSLQTGSTGNSKLTNDTASTVDAPARESASPCPQASALAKRLNASRENVISTLLRRSYIYFSSLLQEPEAKWKHTSDSRGVSVTQLQSIDPTLTVYRAEATFVGVGVWNVLSAITTAGARLYWDKSLTEVKLLEELNDLSSLWQIKQKGSWPIAPRDSILITTTYKSPASVHIFSVSTDDSNLFPSIQPPTPGYIRARTEILGWSIESLSPTTTQITLIDQHDPLGWSPKSWTPAQLIAQVANVGEFAMKSGGPPLITRISGARVTLSKYEHDKGTFRAEYTASESALTPAIMDPSHSTTCSIDASDTSSVECEIRCDCESWAVSLDIVVDPPPTKASCLKRHKLSSGGGWWITIEHDPNLLERDKAKILIRRGRTGLDEKGSVTLNGTNLKVDIEELSAEEAKSLATQRRVKASLIPLDQYSLSGPRMWRGSPSVSNPGTRSSTPNPVRGQEECTAPVPDVASLHPIATSLKLSEPLRPSHPMASALEALAVLQTFHIEQGPDIMVPPAGWTLVAEKGSASVYKKRVPQISETFPVYRADQVIQGVTAEEMVSVLATFSSRPLWDDGVETSYLLESYGNGCTTRLLTTKPTFPFKARLLQTANVHALLQLPSSSISSSTTAVHFLASASFKQPGDGLLTNSKLNPQGLVEAHVFLEGWIMETVDPYSSSSHEIPSTRCTHFSAIDYGSSLPVALNSILNSSLPRMISGLATLVKSHGPVPRLCQPVFGLRMNSSLRTDGLADWKWKLDGADTSKIALSVDATPDSPFRAMFLLEKGANEPTSNDSPTASGGPSSAHSASRYETIRQLGVAFPPTSDSSSGSTFVRRLVSNPDLQRKASTGQLRRTGASWTSNLHGAHVISPKASELVVAELALDRKFYPHGCRVSWKACFLKPGTKAIIEKDIKFPFPPEADTLMLPLKVSFHQMPSPTIFAASLDPAVRREHILLRMTLPVGEIHSPIKDPLTSHSDSEPSPPPLWYTRMSKRATVVHLSIEQITASKDGDMPGPPHEHAKGLKKSQDLQAIVNGEKKKVIPIEESQAELERREVDDYVGVYPSISRLGRISSTLPKRQVSQPTLSSSVVESVLPPEMERPLATSIDFKSDSDDHPGSCSLPGSAMESPHLLSPVNEVREPEEEGGKQNLIHGSHNLEVESINRPQNGSFEAFKNFIFRSHINSHPKNNATASKNEQAKQSTSFLRRFICRKRTYTNRHLVLTALISFLLGSILRSMLIPSDYLIIPPSPPPSSKPCFSYPPSSPSSAVLSTTATLNEDIKADQGGGAHHASDFCATPSNQHQSYFRLSESDQQLLKLLETRNHWKQLRKIFDFNLNFFSYFLYSSWSIVIAFVKN